ncbi:MAG: hypothetical protein ACOX2J_06205 [Bacillota bacterium]
MAKGDKIGILNVNLPDGSGQSFDLVAGEDVPRGGLFRRAWDGIKMFFLRMFGRI